MGIQKYKWTLPPSCFQVDLRSSAAHPVRTSECFFQGSVSFSPTQCGFKRTAAPEFSTGSSFLRDVNVGESEWGREVGAHAEFIQYYRDISSLAHRLGEATIPAQANGAAPSHNLIQFGGGRGGGQAMQSVHPS